MRRAVGDVNARLSFNDEVVVQVGKEKFVSGDTQLDRAIIP